MEPLFVKNDCRYSIEETSNTGGSRLASDSTILR
jgi:hypothetical protein